MSSQPPKFTAQDLIGDIAPKLAEITDHLAFYSGWPTAMSALLAAKDLLHQQK